MLIIKNIQNINKSKLFQFRPNFAAAWMNLGIVLTNLNESEEAEHCYKMAIRHRNKYPDCYYNLGNLVNRLFN